ncbi:hypothetical protein ACFSYJ_12660 [Amycolatopsis samaneae]|uniref:Uncharacterized protein n=1 Tax=Amycolatopsis samaneae TaxID=664691 RepID=A0ABW5GGH0_9PSEU
MVLTVAGASLDLFRTEPGLGRHRLSGDGFGSAAFLRTAWDTRFTVGGRTAATQPAAPVGIPLIIATLLLVVAVAVGVRYALRGSAGVLARRLTAAGAVFLAGVVCTIGVGGIDWSTNVDMETSPEPGMWLLVAAVVVAAAATVMIHLRGPAPTAGWADPHLAFADTPTPSTGVSITVLPPEPPPTPPWAPEHGERS